MRKPGPVCYLVCTAIFSVSGLMAQARMNFTDLKQDTQVFEKIIDERVKLNFSNPFALSMTPQASYVQGYGLIVMLYLRIDRAKIRLPFGEIDAPNKQHAEDIEKKIEKVRKILSECLSTHAGDIKQLGAHDRISISAHIEDRNELDPIKRRRVMVISTTKDDADLLAMRRITLEEFNKRLHVLEY